MLLVVLWKKRNWEEDTGILLEDKNGFVVLVN